MQSSERKSVLSRLLAFFARPAKADGEDAAKELQTLRTALNEIADGIILLDRDLRLDFINRAACDFAGAPMPDPAGKQTYAELIRGAHVATSHETLDQFIARRVATVLKGDPTPVEVSFAGGKVARSRCVVLPSGGRLLTYTDLTDIGAPPRRTAHAPRRARPCRIWRRAARSGSARSLYQSLVSQDVENA